MPQASDDHNERDREANRLTGRLSRYAKVGTGVGMVIFPLISHWLIAEFNWKTALAILGALILIRVKAGFVRYLLIGFMFFACFGLITKALDMLGVIGPVPQWLNGLVFLGVFAAVTRAILNFTRPPRPRRMR